MLTDFNNQKSIYNKNKEIIVPKDNDKPSNIIDNNDSQIEITKDSSNDNINQNKKNWQLILIMSLKIE